MPPRSNKRAKRLSAETEKAALALQERAASHCSSPATFSNSKGSKVLELPLELLMEILSHFECPPVPITARSNGYSSRYLQRTDALRLLSQTCKLWRNIFFPLLWERLEPCLTHSESGAWYKVHGESLIRKSFLVCENPQIASLVRSMNIILSRYSVGTVLPACVRAIEALPNLHTLQVIRTHDQMTTALKGAFAGHVFPQVQTIALPSHAHNILRCCPEVRKIICNNRDDSSKLVSAIAKVCKKVEEVEGFRGSEKVMKRLAKAAPNLRSIKFDYVVPLPHLQHFSSSKKLAHVTLYSNQKFEDVAITDTELLACINLGKHIVRKVAEGRRSVTVEHYASGQNLNKYQEWSWAFVI